MAIDFKAREDLLNTLIEKLSEEIAVERKARDIYDKEVMTFLYIYFFLTPNAEFKEEISISKKYKGALMYLDYDTNKIENYIKSMNYYEFLKTPYWKTVSLKKKQEANFRCQLCNSNGSLATHHRTYKIRGRELQHLNELIVLCSKCHEKFHDISNEKVI